MKACCDLCRRDSTLPFKADCGHVFCLKCLRILLPQFIQGCPGAASFRLTCNGVAPPSSSGSSTVPNNITFPLLPRLTAPLNQLYVQNGEIGLASYWFDSNLKKSYILYDPNVCPWFLDDGSQPPARKFFEDPSYDPASRTFTATVTWSPVTFRSDCRWMYQVVFSEDFVRIVGGEIRAINQLGGEEFHRYGITRNEQLNYHIALGMAAMPRLIGIVMLLTMCSGLDIPRIRRRSSFRLLSKDLIVLLRSYLF